MRSSFACGALVELRAWFCASVRASDALRCVPARRVLKLSRINGFHLYDLLHAQQFLLVRVFGKRKVLTGLTEQDKKDILHFLLVLAEQRAIRTTRAPCLASQALSFQSVLFLLPLVEQRARVHPLFATSPGIAAAV